jgi:hypothetical protein
MTNIKDEIKIKIMDEYIEPNYVDDIDSLLIGKKNWKKVGQVFETMSKVLVAVGSILSFSAGTYDDKLLSFIAGSVSVISLSALQFSSFCYRESKKQSGELNNILEKIGLTPIPVTERFIEESNLMARKVDNHNHNHNQDPNVLNENEELKKEIERLNYFMDVEMKKIYEEKERLISQLNEKNNSYTDQKEK